jgi:hypothetical protein
LVFLQQLAPEIVNKWLATMKWLPLTWHWRIWRGDAKTINYKPLICIYPAWPSTIEQYAINEHLYFYSALVPGWTAHGIPPRHKGLFVRVSFHSFSL